MIEFNWAMVLLLVMALYLFASGGTFRLVAMVAVVLLTYSIMSANSDAIGFEHPVKNVFNDLQMPNFEGLAPK